MTAGNYDLLKEKAKLLLARERELLAMRRKHKRLSLWLTVAQALAEVVDPNLDLPEVCARVSDRIVATLDLHTVAMGLARRAPEPRRREPPPSRRGPAEAAAGCSERRERSPTSP
jgi:hypothetical protein